MAKVFLCFSQQLIEDIKSDEQFGSWSKTYQFDVHGAYLEQPLLESGAESDTFALPVKPGDSIYSLSVIFSSGDSYGTARGKGELVWCFPTYEAAEAAEKAYQDAIALGECSVVFDVITETGEIQQVTVNNLGYGYHEDIQQLVISTHSLE